MSEELRKRHPTVDPFLLKKWERIFNAFFDRNAGGDVDWGDFYLVTRQVRDIYGAESDQMKYAKASMKSLWDGLIATADKNKDDVISIDEWIEVLKGCDQKNEPKWFNEYLTYMFKLFDVSGDHLLDLAEYTDGMMAYCFPTEDSHAAFAKFSVDKYGKPLKGVDLKQFRQLWLDYFWSKDKNAAGNHLFGLLKD